VDGSVTAEPLASIAGGLRILLASADHDVVDRLSRTMREAEHTVVATRRSGRMLVRALEESFDLAILDLASEDMDGFEALQVLRRARPDLPVVVLVDDVGERTDRMIRAEGAAYQFRKPLDFGEFASVLQQLSKKCTGRGAVGVEASGEEAV